MFGVNIGTHVLTTSPAPSASVPLHWVASHDAKNKIVYLKVRLQKLFNVPALCLIYPLGIQYRHHGFHRLLRFRLSTREFVGYSYASQRTHRQYIQHSQQHQRNSAQDKQAFLGFGRDWTELHDAREQCCRVQPQSWLVRKG
jgi:hypothetical protein